MKNENLAFAIRGKTDRQRKRDAFKQKEKQLIQLDKKETQLYHQKRNLGFELLENPYQKGFKRFFVVREDIAQSKYGEFYNELLTYINSTKYSLRKDFKKSKKIKRKRVYVEISQELESFHDFQFKKIPEKFKPCFWPTLAYHPNFKSFEMKYKFIDPWKYVLKTEPNIITHRRKIDHELEQEISQIENKIERCFLRNKINKAKSKRTKYKEWKVADNKKQIPMYKIIEQNNEQD
jgi:hypothetical protein